METEPEKGDFIPLYFLGDPNCFFFYPATNVGIDYFQFYVPFFENVHSGGWGYLISDGEHLPV